MAAPNLNENVENYSRRRPTTSQNKLPLPLLAKTGESVHSLKPPACSCVSITAKKPHGFPNRAAFIGGYPSRVDSLFNHYVINHTRIAYVYVNNTHANAGFDRRSDGLTRPVHNATGPPDNISARFIRAVLANNQRFDRLITGGRAFLSRHREGRSGYGYWFYGSCPLPFTLRTRLRKCHWDNERKGESDNYFLHNASLLGVDGYA
jgi:hypothetical protein